MKAKSQYVKLSMLKTIVKPEYDRRQTPFHQGVFFLSFCGKKAASGFFRVLPLFSGHV